MVVAVIVVMMVVSVIVVMMVVAVIVAMMVVKIGDRDCGYDGGGDGYEKNLDCLEDA